MMCRSIQRIACIASPKRKLNTSATLMKIFEVQTEEDFKKKVLSAAKPVVVDFHARWCGPCKILDVSLREVMEKFEDKLDLARVDIDLLPEVAMSYDVSSIPAVIGFVDGVKKSGFVGAKDQRTITNFLQELLIDK